MEKQQLEQLYVQQGLSVRQIGKVLSKSPHTVCRYLKQFEIKARPFSTKGLKPRLGAVLSTETKRKIGLKSLGRRHSIKTRKKISKSLLGLAGERNRNWKGGRSITKGGYVMILVAGEYIREHRHVVEQEIGRKLKNSEHVHHINGNKQDN